MFTYLSYLLHIDKKCSSIVSFIVTFVQAQNDTVLIFYATYIYALIFISGNILSITLDSLGNNVFN